MFDHDALFEQIGLSDNNTNSQNQPVSTHSFGTAY